MHVLLCMYFAGLTVALKWAVHTKSTYGIVANHSVSTLQLLSIYAYVPFTSVLQSTNRMLETAFEVNYSLSNSFNNLLLCSLLIILISKKRKKLKFQEPAIIVL